MTSFVQDHIHLSSTLSSTPEFSPNIKWTVKYGSRSMQPVVYVTIDEAINGAIQHQSLLDDSGNPVSKMNYKYQLVLSADNGDGLDAWGELDLLLAMHGKSVFHCDNYHPANGTDHTPKVHKAILMIDSIPDFDIKITRHYVPITLFSNDIV